ncbi:uncharacterized protein BO80DRAFT_96278 [Aspergillus ibericus CBS 121593]|uniref:Uncharacterized protein n=1 Tax=Aspergillus ibericus CBS 121593 TaxID=1448316 RepID=A0A395GYT9_9EURO|nr:hypothetical protein BO80DRAFT_96278 [Aspergillus ibericus CBS 121593]RAL00726.1 hypothetical protein BO80DRAFT_96278 [Aspergillus ibericus CBS 121593]
MIYRSDPWNCFQWRLNCRLRLTSSSRRPAATCQIENRDDSTAQHTSGPQILPLPHLRAHPEGKETIEDWKILPQRGHTETKANISRTSRKLCQQGSHPSAAPVMGNGAARGIHREAQGNLLTVLWLGLWDKGCWFLLLRCPSKNTPRPCTPDNTTLFKHCLDSYFLNHK